MHIMKTNPYIYLTYSDKDRKYHSLRGINALKTWPLKNAGLGLGLVTLLES